MMARIPSNVPIAAFNGVPATGIASTKGAKAVPETLVYSSARLLKVLFESTANSVPGAASCPRDKIVALDLRTIVLEATEDAQRDVVARLVITDSCPVASILVRWMSPLSHSGIGEGDLAVG